MKFTLEIELGCEEMRTDSDVRQALIETAHKMRISAVPEDGDEGKIVDENGNIVGKWEVVDETLCARCGVAASEHGYWDVSDPTTHVWMSKR